MGMKRSANEGNDNVSKKTKGKKSSNKAVAALFAPPSFKKATGKTGYFDTALATYAGNTTGSIALLNTIPNGNTVVTRVGKRIVLKSIQMRGLVTSDTATLISQVAWMIIYDKRPTGALPLVTEILNTIDPNAFLNDTNSDRFVIIHRWSGVNIGNTTTPNTSEVAYNIDEYIKFPKSARDVTFKALGTGAIADIGVGAVYIVSVGGNVAGAADSNVQMGTRIRFWDIDA